MKVVEVVVPTKGRRTIGPPSRIVPWRIKVLPNGHVDREHVQDEMAHAIAVTFGSSSTTDALRFLVDRPATVVVEHAHVWVELPLASVDIDVRRAGLDRDPGWLPWIEERWLYRNEDGAAWSVALSS